MAIAEAEPKKSEVAVTSAGVGDEIKDEVLNGDNNFVKNKGYDSSSSSTSVGTVKRYNLYDNIKGFRFEMPDGWNDEDIALFVACCLEKKDDFSKANIDKTKIWASIAQSGAKKSENPSLFTINSCLELAERIRYYVSKNMSIFSDNESFMNFHSDVKSLLPHFSDNLTENEGNKNNSESKAAMNELTSELLNNDSDLADIIHDIMVENATAIRSGNHNVWDEMSSKLKERLGINTDSKIILESEKNKIISDVNKMVEKGINRRDAFVERARGFIEVFDYIDPMNIKVSSYITSSVDSTMDSPIDFKDETVVEEGTYSLDDVVDNDMIHKSVEASTYEYHIKEDVTAKVKKGKRGRPPKVRKTKNKVTESKETFFEEIIDVGREVSSEPTSTTPFDALFGRQKLDKQGIDIIGENKLFNKKSSSKVEVFNTTVTTPNKSPGRRKKERLMPERIMPSRVARNKVVSYYLNRNSNSKSSKDLTNCRKSAPVIVENRHTRQQSNQISLGIVNNDKENAKKSPNFRGFDPDSEDTIDNFGEFKRITSAKSTSTTKARVANPDTTTDFDDKLASINLGVSEVPDLRKINRKRKDITNRKQKDRGSKEEDLGIKVRRVHADSTMKNLVVKLVDCQQSPSSMDYPSHGSIVSLPKQQEKSAPYGNRIRSDRNKEGRLIEETVVLAKDVVDSEYNPNSDSAKLVSDEHLNQGQHSNLLNEAATSLKDSHQYSKSLDFSSPMSTSNVGSSLLAGKRHVNPFCGISQNNLSEGSTSASVSSASGSSDSMSLANRSLNLASICSKLQENTVSPYNPTAGTSSSVLEANQKPSTSTGNLASLTSPSALETALATLKKGGREFLSNQDNSLCISSSSTQNRFIAEIEGSKIPDWFENFITDYRKREAWKIQQLLKMQQELADVELRKVLLLEKIYGSLMKQ